MSVAEIQRLPFREKFEIMEALWGDLSERIEQVPVAQAEQDLLDSRLARIENGEAQILDWEKVKGSIGEQ